MPKRSPRRLPANRRSRYDGRPEQDDRAHSVIRAVQTGKRLGSEQAALLRERRHGRQQGCVEPNNRKEGIWVRFDRSGNLIKGENYHNFDWHNSRGRVSSTPQVGDVAFWKFSDSWASNYSASHAGIVIGVSGGNAVIVDAAYGNIIGISQEDGSFEILQLGDDGTVTSQRI